MTFPEFVKLKTLAEAYDCDVKTLAKLLKKLEESYSIETVNWNGIIRINYKQFRRAIMDQTTQTF